jgi:ribosomal protein S12 methylthiotransferase accessory factor
MTRLADITGLDRIGIPVFSAVVPRSDDFISIYSGKGLSRDHALAGALMETIERQSTLAARPQLLTAPVAELRGRVSIVEPSAIVSRLADSYSDTRPYDWVEGFDLLTGGSTLVPAGIAGYRWRHLPHGTPMRRTTTHGLAAGNCLEEAIAQALCELVERDAWTLAELSSHWRPRAALECALGYDPCLDFEDDLERCPCIDLAGIGEPVDTLLARFRRAGLDPIVRDISSDLGIPVLVAAVAEDDVPAFPQAHMGVGAHPELRVAAARALTEAAQSRAADIQGVREDLAPAEGDGSGVVIHTRRVRFVDRRRWLHRRSAQVRDWRDIGQHRHADVLGDIELVLERLQRAGIDQIVVIDFSPPDTGLFVVRVLASRLEMWIADHGRFGERAAEYWRRLEGAERRDAVSHSETRRGRASARPARVASVSTQTGLEPGLSIACRLPLAAKE